MDCPCATLDDAMAELDRLRQTVEMLTVRVERLTVQARKAGLIPVETLDTDELSAIDLARVLGLSRQRIYKLSTMPGFPPQIAPGRWSVSAVLKWREAYRASLQPRFREKMK